MGTTLFDQLTGADRSPGRKTMSNNATIGNNDIMSTEKNIVQVALGNPSVLNGVRTHLQSKEWVSNVKKDVEKTETSSDDKPKKRVRNTSK